jgi:hypothetical protein
MAAERRRRGIPAVRPRPATLPDPTGRPVVVWRLSALADAPIIRRQVDGRTLYRLTPRSMMPAGFEPLDITESPIITRRIDPTP